MKKLLRNQIDSISTGEKIVFVGCHLIGHDLLRMLCDSQIKIDYIVSIDEQTAQSGKVAGYKDYSAIASEYNIQIYYAKNYSLNSTQDYDFFMQNKFSILIQGGWQRLFPKNVLDSLKIGAIGVHGSSEFLPLGRGRSPINWSLIEGKNRFIMHYFIMKPGIDDGNIFHYEMFDINEWDDCRTLYYKNVFLTSKILVKYIPLLIKGRVVLFPQVGTASYYPKRTEDDGIIDWNKSIYENYNLIRALTKPYPGAFTFGKSGKILIWKAQPFDTRLDSITYKIGQVVELFSTRDFIVKCAGGLLLITDYEGVIEKNEILQ